MPSQSMAALYRCSLAICFRAALALLAAPAVFAADIAVHVADRDGRPVADVVVYAQANGALPAGNAAPGVAPRSATIEQVGEEFVPYVTAVQVGTSIQFPNRDNTRHHVYSFSPAKRFDLPLYTGSTAAPVLFDKPGIVVIGCNIHDWMIGYIDVLNTPYFGKSDANGAVELKDLPAGDYTVHIWHPDLSGADAAQEKPIALGNQTVELSWRIALKPSPRRRAPLPAERGY